MSSQRTSAADHGFAARQNDHAALYHRSASRHFQIGKDYGHAAHQALLAHGHALLADTHARAAAAYYIDHHRTGIAPTPPERSAIPPLPISASAHHEAAADDHDQAARHHRAAAWHLTAHDLDRAGHEAHLARWHQQRAVLHGEEAVMLHVEHHGIATPSAELA